MTELLAGAVGFLIGMSVSKLQAARNRFAKDLAFIRSLPEPPSHCRLIDDDTDGLTL